jgi:hypothetical protein
MGKVQEPSNPESYRHNTLESTSKKPFPYSKDGKSDNLRNCSFFLVSFKSVN